MSNTDSIVFHSDFLRAYNWGEDEGASDEAQVEYIGNSLLTAAILSKNPVLRPLQVSKEIDPNIQATANKIAQAAENIFVPQTEEISFANIFNWLAFKIEFYRHHDSGGWTRQMRIYYFPDGLFFIGYAAAILDFSYRHKEILKSLNGDTPHIRIIKRAAAQEGQLPDLSNVVSMERIIMWLKTLAEPEGRYTPDQKGWPYIEKLFQKVGLQVNIAKDRTDSKVLPIFSRSEPDLEDVFVSSESYGELIWEGENTISYWTD